jgi:hypothetical protein
VDDEDNGRIEIFFGEIGFGLFGIGGTQLEGVILGGRNGVLA